jgi:hypothetical protein
MIILQRSWTGFDVAIAVQGLGNGYDAATAVKDGYEAVTAVHRLVQCCQSCLGTESEAAAADPGTGPVQGLSLRLPQLIQGPGLFKD